MQSPSISKLACIPQMDTASLAAPHRNHPGSLGSAPCEKPAELLVGLAMTHKRRGYKSPKWVITRLTNHLPDVPAKGKGRESRIQIPCILSKRKCIRKRLFKAHPPPRNCVFNGVRMWPIQVLLGLHPPLALVFVYPALSTLLRYVQGPVMEKEKPSR